MITVEAVQHCLEEKGDPRRPFVANLVEARIGIIGANGSGKSSFARLLKRARDPCHRTRHRAMVMIQAAKGAGRSPAQGGLPSSRIPITRSIYPIVEEDPLPSA